MTRTTGQRTANPRTMAKWFVEYKLWPSYAAGSHKLPWMLSERQAIRVAQSAREAWPWVKVTYKRRVIAKWVNGKRINGQRRQGAQYGAGLVADEGRRR